MSAVSLLSSWEGDGLMNQKFERLWLKGLNFQSKAMALSKSKPGSREYETRVLLLAEVDRVVIEILSDHEFFEMVKLEIELRKGGSWQVLQLVHGANRLKIPFPLLGEEIAKKVKDKMVNISLRQVRAMIAFSYSHNASATSGPMASRDVLSVVHAGMVPSVSSTGTVWYRRGFNSYDVISGEQVAGADKIGLVGFDASIEYVDVDWHLRAKPVVVVGGEASPEVKLRRLEAGGGKMSGTLKLFQVVGPEADKAVAFAKRIIQMRSKLKLLWSGSPELIRGRFMSTMAKFAGLDGVKLIDPALSGMGQSGVMVSNRLTSNEFWGGREGYLITHNKIPLAIALGASGLANEGPFFKVEELISLVGDLPEQESQLVSLVRLANKDAKLVRRLRQSQELQIMGQKWIAGEASLDELVEFALSVKPAVFGKRDMDPRLLDRWKVWVENVYLSTFPPMKPGSLALVLGRGEIVDPLSYFKYGKKVAIPADIKEISPSCWVYLGSAGARGGWAKLSPVLHPDGFVGLVRVSVPYGPAPTDMSGYFAFDETAENPFALPVTLDWEEDRFLPAAGSVRLWANMPEPFSGKLTVVRTPEKPFGDGAFATHIS